MWVRFNEPQEDLVFSVYLVCQENFCLKVVMCRSHVSNFPVKVWWVQLMRHCFPFIRLNYVVFWITDVNVIGALTETLRQKDPKTYDLHLNNQKR